ncbi:transport and Golgi organization protein 1 homolog [Dasypus novemcinctus]|uniref:transport and Golgi organization protein 1 homolog n=1 Tax=Dasypus novemcinctus TaxID=9361 RepID=UPI00265E9954|nr:transport and Golgi organization protein 1 homolog [Dasypus novemcinctus]
MEALEQLFWILLLCLAWQVPGHPPARVGCTFRYFSTDLIKAVYEFTNEKLGYLTDILDILPYNFLCGPDFYGYAVNIVASLGIISVAIFFWKFILADNITTISGPNKLLHYVSQSLHVTSESKRHQNVKHQDLEINGCCKEHMELSEESKSLGRSQKDLKLNPLQGKEESKAKKTGGDTLRNRTLTGDCNRKVDNQMPQMVDVLQAQNAVSENEDLNLLQDRLRVLTINKDNVAECLKEVENDYNSLLSLKASMEEECRSVMVKTESLQEVREQRKKTMQDLLELIHKNSRPQEGSKIMKPTLRSPDARKLPQRDPEPAAAPVKNSSSGSALPPEEVAEGKINTDARRSPFFPGSPLMRYPMGGPLSAMLRYGPSLPPWWPLGSDLLPPPPPVGQPV